MRNPKFATTQDYLDHLTPDHRIIMDRLKDTFLTIPHIQESIKRNCLHYRFPNGMRCYINTHKLKHPVLGYSRGARLCREYPLMSGLFDEIAKVVGKIVIYDIHTIHDKAIAQFVIFIDELPKGIGVL